MDRVSNEATNHLKDISFFAWRVGRKQEQRKMEQICKSLYERPRQRRETQH